MKDSSMREAAGLLLKPAPDAGIRACGRSLAEGWPEL